MLTRTGPDNLFNLIYLAHRRPRFLPRDSVCRVRVESQVPLAACGSRVWFEGARRAERDHWTATLCYRLGRPRRLKFQTFISPTDFYLLTLPLLQIPDVEITFVGANKDLKIEESRRGSHNFRVTWNAPRRCINKSVLLCERVAISDPTLKAFGIYNRTGECFNMGDSEVYFELDTDEVNDNVQRNQLLFDFNIHFTCAVKLHANY